ncbi:MAG: DedA family protein [Syntrophomonadaceae bacterium]|nr:DedA family protein [Syntrophomonadaceae bacterium]
MQNWIIDFMELFGYISILLLTTLENVFPPIPSELILTFGGFMTTYTTLTIPGVVVFATLGSIIGAVILYGLGYFLRENGIEYVINRYGHILRVELQDVHSASSWFKKYGYWTVFFCRMIPLIRSLISIPAGMAKMNLGLFLLYTLAGTLIWNILLVGAGAIVGESWETIIRFMDVYSDVAYLILGLAGIIFVIYWFRRKR